MSPADALRAFLQPILAPGNWRMQFGRWTDGTKTDRFAVIKPVGGLPAELIRQPQFTLLLIGGSDDPTTLPDTTAQAVIAAMLGGSGDLVFMQPAEPVYWATDDGRPIAELAISTIVNT
ncbi:hypothetical protein BH10PSE18_BH10PSE18_08330 [soil metagenome]